MPYDANGIHLKVGDRVLIPAKVTSIAESNDFCNCSVELEAKMPPNNQSISLGSINTRQMFLREMPEESVAKFAAKPKREGYKDGTWDEQ